ncbi:hypothetical protein F2P56_000721 [Juglans regia]|uniref:Protein PLASTID MOVEMENT IMPAIRED 2 n=2 Tax=Juglans regia TaxID=51240 RepID=A0A833YE31_JUGRE|nr:protein PLASTID MOVEMENT IMPAIRED 2 isoform X2 [Juglans regia]KAF5479940.1 hypothetical protein F2P56_000721 [Juglans regia]
MDRAEFGNRRTGTVKAAINLYGDRVLEGAPQLKKAQMDFLESSSRARELHLARREIVQYEDSKRDAESARAQAESDLSNAKKTVKDMSSLIEKSNLKAKAKVRDIEMLKKSRRRDARTVTIGDIESDRYAEVMRELEFVKQELSKLKLDMDHVLEQKSRAEMEVKASTSKMFSYSKSVRTLRKEIEESNEEQVLVEVARIEALKEHGEIEAQRKKEATEFFAAMETTKQKVKDITDDIDQSKELETKLAITLSDVGMLQNELKLVKEIDKKVQRNDSLNRGSFRKEEELGASPSLESVKEELEAAKNELALVREEGFQFMASMDVIRNELKHVKEETARFKKIEEKSDLTVQNLNSKLLRAKSKLEAVSAAEEKASSIVSNLLLTLEQLKTEAEVAEREKELITAETAAMREDVLKTESHIDLTEERLQVAMQELEVVKSSEAFALERLKTLIENTMRSRASTSRHSSKITISKFEYEYLNGRAGGAQEIADKKVAAAHAWIEALKASEKEMLMKSELAEKEIRETRVMEERVAYRANTSLSSKRMVEGGLQNWRQKREKNAENSEAENFQLASHRKSLRINGNLTPSRRAKFRMSASPAARKSDSPAARKSASPGARHINSFTIKKKKKVMPNLAKLFSGKKNDNDR